jgi:hypothetical protein
MYAPKGIRWIREPYDKENNRSILDKQTIILWIPEYAEDSETEYEYLTDKIAEGYRIVDIHKISNEEHKYHNWKKLKLKNWYCA